MYYNVPKLWPNFFHSLTKRGKGSGFEKHLPLFKLWTTRMTVLKRSEEHTSELQSPCNLVCRLLLEKKKNVMQSTSEIVEYVNLVMSYRPLGTRPQSKWRFDARHVSSADIGFWM